MTGYAVLERYEGASLRAGLNRVTGAALAMIALALLDLPGILVVLVIPVAAFCLIGGVVLHLSTLSAWEQRNERHRKWLKTRPATELLDFRKELVVRERELELARQTWGWPLVAALVVSASAVVVPYQMVGSFAPAPLVEPVNLAWAVLTLALAATCTVLAVLAAHRQESGPREVTSKPTGFERHVDA